MNNCTIRNLIEEQYPSIAANGIFGSPVTFDIGFVNPERDNHLPWGNSSATDETELDAESIEELEELYTDFCIENNLPTDTVAYVDIAR